MQWIRIVLLACIANTLQAAPLPAVGAHTQVKLPDARLQRILTRFEGKLPQMMHQLGAPGAAVAVVYKGDIVYLKPFGVKRLGHRSQINIDTLFQLGSVSKPMAAALATNLAADQHFSLDDRIDQYLPQFKMAMAYPRSPLRIRNILSHTTGIPRAGFNRLIESYHPYSQILSRLQLTPHQCVTGTCYDYHNVAFSLIGDIVSATTRLSYEDALRYYLLKPLNMKRTSVNLMTLLNDTNKAYPHVKTKRGRTIPCKQFSKGYYAVAPSGGVNSSVKDMAIFLQAQLGKYPLVLKPAAIDEMLTPHILTPDILERLNHKAVAQAYYGLGWRILNFSNTKLVFHGGWLKGFSNVIAFLPEQDIGIVILQNGETRFSWAATAKFFELFLNLPESETVFVKKAAPRLARAKKRPLKRRPLTAARVASQCRKPRSSAEGPNSAG